MDPSVVDGLRLRPVCSVGYRLEKRLMGLVPALLRHTSAWAQNAASPPAHLLEDAQGPA